MLKCSFVNVRGYGNPRESLCCVCFVFSSSFSFLFFRYMTFYVCLPGASHLLFHHQQIFWTLHFCIAFGTRSWDVENFRTCCELNGKHVFSIHYFLEAIFLLKGVFIKKGKGGFFIFSYQSNCFSTQWFSFLLGCCWMSAQLEYLEKTHLALDWGSSLVLQFPFPM